MRLLNVGILSFVRFARRLVAKERQDWSLQRIDRAAIILRPEDPLRYLASASFAAEYDDASMGPRLVSRGNGCHFGSFNAIYIASMGPRLVSRGNVEEENKRLRELLLQWGRGLLAAEITLYSLTVSLYLKLQWGRGLLAAEILVAALQA
jgi:hypothetical protein